MKYLFIILLFVSCNDNVTEYQNNYEKKNVIEAEEIRAKRIIVENESTRLKIEGVSLEWNLISVGGTSLSVEQNDNGEASITSSSIKDLLERIKKLEYKIEKLTGEK